jgi:ferredoxin, 2Fe-2S
MAGKQVHGCFLSAELQADNAPFLAWFWVGGLDLVRRRFTWALQNVKWKTMVKLTYIEHDGTEHAVEVNPGITLMEAAVNNMVPGIDADCGGACACATCHVYIDPAFAKITGSAESMEESMLDFASDPKPESRLSCQITVTEAMDGLVLRMPRSQG